MSEGPEGTRAGRVTPVAVRPGVNQARGAGSATTAPTTGTGATSSIQPGAAPATERAARWGSPGPSAVAYSSPPDTVTVAASRATETPSAAYR